MTIMEERLKIMEDLHAHKIPKRIPIMAGFTVEFACGLAGVDLMKAHYDIELKEKAYNKVCETFMSDAMPISDLRLPAPYQMLGAKNWILSSNGAVQHPEIEVMRDDEYDKLIENPYNFIMDELLARVCSNLNGNPIENGVVVSKAYSAYQKIVMQNGMMMGKLIGQYGYVSNSTQRGVLIEAPFDFLSDQLRGFKGATLDSRRQPENVKAACEAILPLMLRRGANPNVTSGAFNFIPLHLAPYLNKKQFEELYWPTFEKLLVELDKKGIRSDIFAEEDWTRFASFLEKVPKSTIITFEYGDYKLLKEVVGKDHVIAGFYDPTISLTRTKEECIDEAKRLVDVCGKDGKFIFKFNKGVIDVKSINVDKIQAVLDWVYHNTDY